ncbi:MAG: hypothetical protein CXT73_01960 [Methanobacteriota archaeon]|nr:MAG: hypothetical protein CXT73_01960 [Euryarchaeota archaeon]
MIPQIKTENELRKLAGIPIKEAEGGSLDNIIAKHREAFESVMRGDSSLYDHDEFYDELYEHYVSSGEMPYGIAKARDGDPDQWIQEELDREYGDDFATDDGEPMDGDFDSAMASAGMGTDEDYGYYGESKQPKTFKEHLKAVQEGNLQSDINKLSNQQQGQIDLKKNVQAHDEMTTKLGVDPLKSTQALMYAKKQGIEPSAMVQQTPQYKMRSRGYKSDYSSIPPVPPPISAPDSQQGNLARVRAKARRDA